ncbi:hypothetical protein ACJIZ3_023457 [Penstemon smallii]|uniref:Replication factor A C-terminal domain-containing protein n=1 Tax=Penstemon smallii TaxID=265156 RepID=A0ABD3TP54_9LAMI
MMFIKEVTPALTKWSVKVIVHEKTQPRVSQHGGRRHQQIVFMDETGHKVMGVIYEDDIDKLKDDFRVSSTYNISNAKLKRIEDKYNKFSYPYQWTINRHTLYHEEKSDVIPRSLFKTNFVNLSEIKEKSQPNVLIDILGIVIRKKNPRNFISGPNQHTLRDFFFTMSIFMLHRQKVVVLTLWNTVAVSEGRLIDDAVQPFPIITATALTYSSFFEGGSLGSTPATVITVEPPIPEAQKLATWRSNNMKTIVDTIGARNYFLRDDSAIPNLEGPYSTIADVVAEDKVDKFVIKANIKIVDAKQKFYYMGCDKCFSGIDAEYNYVYTCNSCKEATIAKPRQKMQVDIYDSTGNLDVTIFGDQCQDILKMDAIMCMDLHNAGNFISINEINENLLGKIFLIKLNKKKQTRGHTTIYQYIVIKLQLHQETAQQSTPSAVVRKNESSSTNMNTPKSAEITNMGAFKDGSPE